jgi:hypothetical protein
MRAKDDQGSAESAAVRWNLCGRAWTEEARVASLRMEPRAVIPSTVRALNKFAAEKLPTLLPGAPVLRYALLPEDLRAGKVQSLVRASLPRVRVYNRFLRRAFS